jgi:transposase InsO family protein
MWTAPDCAIDAAARERSSAPNSRWIAEFTYVWTADGWLYVAAVIDLFSRGWWAGR